MTRAEKHEDKERVWELKAAIDRLHQFGQQLRELEESKSICVYNENYDEAEQIRD